MEQLSATDASFLYAESKRMPMHVAALQIYDPATAPNRQVDINDIIENVHRRAHHIDCYHRKLVEAPWHLDHPFWINDAKFSPAQHVFHVKVPHPGGWQELCGTVSRITAEPLLRDRPLWEMHLLTGLGDIEGIPAGAFAVLTKIHHAAVDGVAGIGVTMALHDLEPVGAVEEPQTIVNEPVPDPLSLLGDALVKESFRPFRFLQAWPALARLTGAALAATPIARAPRTRFNQRISNQRAFDAIRMPLANLKACKTLVDHATVNDVILTIVGGGMRRYLGAHNELPRRSLTAMVPISTRENAPTASEGNQISQMIVKLGTDIKSPLDRLAAVQEATAVAKSTAGQVDAESIATLSALPPAPWLAMAAKNISHSSTNLLANTVVTNVKGPPFPFYTCGAKLVYGYGMGPLADGLGLFHTALSYCGELTLSAFACAEFVPDIEFYAECLQAEYEALLASVAETRTLFETKTV